MGREIRMVAKGWEHPRHTRDNASYENHIGEFIPMYDEDYESALNEWLENHFKWLKGEHKDQQGEDPCKEKYYAEWNGDAPKVKYYRPKWNASEMVCFQLYETVSEGTPVSPAFETKQELIEYLATHGDFWSQHRGSGPYSRQAAEGMVNAGSAPSMVITGGKIYHGAEVFTIPKDSP